MSKLMKLGLLLCISAMCGCLPNIANIGEDIWCWNGEWIPARFEEELSSVPIMIKASNADRAIIVDKSMLRDNVIKRRMVLRGAACVLYDGVMGISAPSYMARELVVKYQNAQSAYFYGQTIDEESASMLSSMPRLKYLAIDTTITGDSLSEEVMLTLGKSKSLEGVFVQTDSEKTYCSYQLVRSRKLYSSCKFLPLRFESSEELQLYLDSYKPEFCDVLLADFTSTICVPDSVRSYRMLTISPAHGAFVDVSRCANLASLSILGNCGHANSCQELIQGLSKCGALRVLVIKTIGFSNDVRGILDMTEVGRLKRLRVLNIEGVTLADWKFCESCDSLEEMYLGNVSAGGNGAAFRMLRKVIAYDSTLSASFLGNAMECPTFEVLELANVSISGEVQWRSMSSKIRTFLMIECRVNTEVWSFIRGAVSVAKGDMVIEGYACTFSEDAWAGFRDLSTLGISFQWFCVYGRENRFYRDKANAIEEDEYYDSLEDYRRILPAYQVLYWTAASRLESVLCVWRLSLSLSE